MRELLLAELQATHCVVEDTSGGCGSMYRITVESPLFEGQRLLAQHRLVTEALKKEIGEMHGLNITTKPSPAGSS